MNKDEKEILAETKKFAKAHNVHWDLTIQLMILNAMREIVLRK